MGFSQALAMLIDLEGGYHTSDLKGDSGFETCAGITMATWTGYCARKGFPAHWPPTIPEVGSFYLTEFWEARACGQLPDQPGAIWFQCAVNLPFAEGNEILQVALNAWPDGVVGAQTLAAISRIPAAELSDRILGAQLQHYVDKRGVLDALFKGLWNRVQTVRTYIAKGLI